MTSVADVVVDPNDGSTIYIVTGYGDRPSFDLRPIGSVNNGATNPLWTAGVFRSMNYGETWECISDGYLSAFQNKAGVARKMIINPDNPNQIFIATSNGVFRTNNAKSSNPYWEQVFIPYHTNKSGNYVLDEELRGLAFHPNDPSIIYLSGREVYVSKSNGDNNTWEYTTGASAGSYGYSGLDLNTISNTFSVYRINIATVPNAPNRVYIYFGGPFSDDYQSVFIYVLENNVWEKKHQDVFTYSSGDTYHSDPWNGFAISPQNKDVIYYGGSRVWEVDISNANSTSNTATDISDYGGSTNESFHADVHDLFIHPNFPDELYCAHHGGVVA